MRAAKGAIRRGQLAAETLMTDTCTVSRVSTVRDPDGVDVEVEQVVYAGRCKVRSFAPQTNEQVSVGAPANTQRYLVHFPVGAAVGDGDIVRVAGRERPLFLRGSSDVTWQTAVRMQAEEVANA